MRQQRGRRYQSWKALSLPRSNCPLWPGLSTGFETPSAAYLSVSGSSRAPHSSLFLVRNATAVFSRSLRRGLVVTPPAATACLVFVVAPSDVLAARPCCECSRGAVFCPLQLSPYGSLMHTCGPPPFPRPPARPPAPRWLVDTICAPVFAVFMHVAGLDNAGKTSLIHRLASGQVAVFNPTIVRRPTIVRPPVVCRLIAPARVCVFVRSVLAGRRSALARSHSMHGTWAGTRHVRALGHE